MKILDASHGRRYRGPTSLYLQNVAQINTNLPARDLRRPQNAKEIQKRHKVTIKIGAKQPHRETQNHNKMRNDNKRGNTTTKCVCHDVVGPFIII